MGRGSQGWGRERPKVDIWIFSGLALLRALIEEAPRGPLTWEVVYSKVDPWRSEDFKDPKKEWLIVDFQTLIVTDKRHSGSGSTTQNS